LLAGELLPTSAFANLRVFNRVQSVFVGNASIGAPTRSNTSACQNTLYSPISTKTVHLNLLTDSIMISSSDSSVLPTSQIALTQTTRLLAKLARERFYGKLTISFEAGNIVSLRKEETLKPADLPR
jgi:hypothetical protein